MILVNNGCLFVFKKVILNLQNDGLKGKFQHVRSAFPKNRFHFDLKGFYDTC